MSPISTSAFGEESPAQDQTAAPVEQTTEEAPKSKRRTKRELIDDAVVPASGDLVKLKDANTSAKYERPWSEAVTMVAEKKAEFIDRGLKYAVLKMEEQRAPLPEAANDTDSESLATSSISQDEADGLEARWCALQEEVDETRASDTEKLASLAEESELVRVQLIDAGYEDVQSDDAYNRRNLLEGDDKKIPRVGNGKFVAAGDAVAQGAHDGLIPDGAQVGDEVRVGSDTLRIGHGMVLTTSPVADEQGNKIEPKRRWQRELGAGKNGPWEATTLHAEQADESTSVPAAPLEIPQEKTISQIESVGADIQKIAGGWRVSAGYLEKIGLPEFSSLQIGPVMVSRDVFVEDETHMISVTREDGTKISAPAEVIAAQRTCFHAAEISMRFERGAMLAFLEAARPKAAS